MAANNYFGFTHGGTQYSAQATAYTPTQGAYVQQTAAYATTPRAATAYDYTNTGTASTGQYAYTTTQRPAVGTPSTGQYAYSTTTAQMPAATSYDTSKAYGYQPAPQTTSYTSTAYKASGTQQRPVTSNKNTSSTSSYVYQTGSQPSATYLTPTTIASTSGQSTTKYAGYDAALYTAAYNYQQQQNKAHQWGKGGGGGGAGGGAKTTAMAFNRQSRPKPQPKTMQLHYCDVCKISCAGPQTYREHLDGQKHKKKEKEKEKAESVSSARGGSQNQLQCKLCDVTCTGTDAYTAHIRGAKHQKVMKLHTILGKPIPSSEPILIAGATAGAATAKGSASATGSKPALTKTVTTGGVKKIVSTPKITFVGAGQLKSTQLKAAEAVKADAAKEVDSSKTIGNGADKEQTVSLASLQENESTPVGHEYIDEVKNEIGKVVSFQCKLCDCKFNDPNAKEMHLKGRRHRLQYKKKVDPNLQVDVKPSIRARKIQEEKLRRQAQKEEYWKRRDEEERWREEMREFEAMQWSGGRGGMMGPQGFGPRGPMDAGWNPMMMRRPDSSDDRHVMSKHASIYPNDEELQAVQSIVSTCEKALKLASDHIADIDAPKVAETEKKPAVKKEEKKAEVKKEEDAEQKEAKKDPTKDAKPEPDDSSSTPRALKGVMRVGVLAKGLLLHGDLHVHLVVLCAEKPTRTLLQRVKDNLPKQIEGFTEEKYDVQLRVEDAAIIVKSVNEPKAACTITLTSPVMREDAPASGETEKLVSPPDVLDRLKCLNALAALRHAKWFQARANGLQSCVIVIRILRDLCQRVPTWAPLNEWAMELLVEKCVASGGRGMSPGDALRRVFECIASGVLLPGGPGLYDPCEKEPTDATVALTNQEREDITASAQHALRLIAFRQIHKVLGMDPLPAPKFTRNQRFNSRKRRRTTSQGEAAGDGDETATADGKKDKKDEDNMETAESK